MGNGLLKRNQRLLPSMPKGETVGNVVIDGKGGASKGNDKGGAPDTKTRQQRGSRGRKKRSKEQ